MKIPEFVSFAIAFYIILISVVLFFYGIGQLLHMLFW